jgi:hypothetical protein
VYGVSTFLGGFLGAFFPDFFQSLKKKKILKKAWEKMPGGNYPRRGFTGFFDVKD